MYITKTEKHGYFNYAALIGLLLKTNNFSLEYAMSFVCRLHIIIIL